MARPCIPSVITDDRKNPPGPASLAARGLPMSEHLDDDNNAASAMTSACVTVVLSATGRGRLAGQGARWLLVSKTPKRSNRLCCFRSPGN